MSSALHCGNLFRVRHVDAFLFFCLLSFSFRRWPRPLRSLIYRFVLVFAHRFSVAVHRSRELVFFLNLFSIARLCRYSLLGFTEFPVSSADRPLPFPEHSFVRKCLCNLRLLRYSYNLKNPRQRTGWFCDSLMGKRNFTEFLPSFT